MMLSWLIAWPFLLGLITFLVKKESSAVFFSLAALGANLALLIYFSLTGFAEFRIPWLPEWGVYFHVRLDGLSLVMLLLTHLMGLMAIFASIPQKYSSPNFYFGNLLILLAGINGVLLASDLLLFFICWEAMILPLYFAVWFWGHNGHKKAAMQFFIFTQSSGLLMLVAILSLYFIAYVQTGVFSFDPEILGRVVVGEHIEVLLLLAFLCALLVKLPACPLHVWLADLFADAPVAPLLMGIMVKTGAYALIRFALTLFPTASFVIAPFMMTLGLFGMFYGALLAYASDDIRKILAYSTISHMGIVLLAIFSHQQQALLGVVTLLVTGAISTGSLLMLFNDVKCRDLREVGGLFAKHPKAGVLTIFLAMASIGIPLFGNFVGEWLILVGIYPVSKTLAVLIALALLTSAVYHVRLLRKLLFGQSHTTQPLSELSRGRVFLYGSLIAGLLIIGLYPSPLLSLLAQNPKESASQYD